MFTFDNAQAYARGDLTAPMKLQKITLNIMIRIFATLLFFIEFDVTVLDETVTVYERGSRMLRSANDFEHLDSTSSPAAIMQAGIGIVEKLPAIDHDARVPVSTYMRGGAGNVRYSEFAGRQLPHSAHLGMSSRRLRREDGASHVQDESLVVTDGKSKLHCLLVLRRSGLLCFLTLGGPGLCSQ